MGMNTITLTDSNGSKISKQITIDTVWDLQEDLMEEYARTHSSNIMHVVQQMDDVACKIEDGVSLDNNDKHLLARAFAMVN
jgi:hypothetical protein